MKSLLTVALLAFATLTANAQTQMVCCYPVGSGGGSGTVTSVGVSAPAEIEVAGSPVTTSGTIALTWAAAAQNTIFAGPSSGGSGTPLFRAMVSTDLPSTITGLTSVTSTAFVGNLTGNVTGNVSGSSGSTTGNAATASALAANPTDCSSNQFATAIAASGALTCAGITDADVPNDVTVTLAATATALASNPTDCAGGEFANAIDASGNLTCAEPAGGGSSLPVVDTTVLVEGSGDATKEFRIEIDGIPTSTTVVMTPPTTSFTAARLDAPQTFNGNQTITGGELILPGTLGTAVRFGSDLDSGWGWRSDNSIAAYVGGGEALELNSTSMMLRRENIYHVLNGVAYIGSLWKEETKALSTGGTTTTTSTNLAQAGTEITAIYARVTSTITTATDWSVAVSSGLAGCTSPWVAVGTTTSAQTSLTATTTVTFVPAAGLRCSVASDTTLTVTTTGTPTAGAVKLMTVYQHFVPQSG